MASWVKATEECAMLDVCTCVCVCREALSRETTILFWHCSWNKKRHSVFTCVWICMCEIMWHFHSNKRKTTVTFPLHHTPKLYVVYSHGYGWSTLVYCQSGPRDGFQKEYRLCLIKKINKSHSGWSLKSTSKKLWRLKWIVSPDLWLALQSLVRCWKLPHKVFPLLSYNVALSQRPGMLLRKESGFVTPKHIQSSSPGLRIVWVWKQACSNFIYPQLSQTAARSKHIDSDIEKSKEEGVTFDSKVTVLKAIRKKTREDSLSLKRWGFSAEEWEQDPHLNQTQTSLLHTANPQLPLWKTTRKSQLFRRTYSRANTEVSSQTLKHKRISHTYAWSTWINFRR